MTRIERTFPYPLCRLNMLQYRAWESGGFGQKAMAIALARTYRKTVGVVAPQPMWLVATIDDRGRVIECPKPWKIINFWEVDNRPEPNDCWCRDYADHENQGHAWHHRFSSTVAMHHPLCQYEPASAQTYKQIMVNPTTPHVRPDGWMLEQKIAREKLGL